MPAAAPSPIVVRYRATPADLPKHARLRAAIVDALQAGELPLGTKMAGERELSAELGLSLGTTQKALGRLMDEGFLVRRQGHGTFVGSIRRPVAGSWHFRFVAPEHEMDGGPELPVYASIVERELVRDEGPWSQALGVDAKGYVRIKRSLDVDGRFLCCSDIYLGATRFARLLRMAEKRLTDTNLKAVLDADFSAPTLQSEGLSNVVQVDAQDARLIGVPLRSWVLQVRIVGRSFGRAPITFQQVVVPPSACSLKLDFNPPGRTD